MGRTMGHHRKGEDRGSVDRPGPRNGSSGRKSSGGKVIPLRGQGRPGDATRARRPSSIGPEARTAVGHRRLWMVAAVFAVTGLLLGGRGVDISLTDYGKY